MGQGQKGHFYFAKVRIKIVIHFELDFFLHANLVSRIARTKEMYVKMLIKLFWMKYLKSDLIINAWNIHITEFSNRSKIYLHKFIKISM